MPLITQGKKMGQRIVANASATATFDRHWPTEHITALEDAVKKEALLNLLPYVNAEIDVLNGRITVRVRLLTSVFAEYGN